MSLIKFTPRDRDIFSDLFAIQREMNQAFNSVFNRDEYTGLTNWNPATDIVEGKDEYTVRIELPGVSKNDVKITIHDNVLTVQGEKKQESENKENNYHRVERSYGSFMRSFRLPSMVKGEKIDANYKDGILTIVLPKAEEAKTKEIEIKF
ncbi:Hsp20/alpha crystallin family protein [bacterium]|nr:Hsp20/alpha crystallin family protein [bacterium]NUN44477.1 Hsp20/alpha crystallin family protein [bacterium]HMV27523.1 Hsp20/alpha crystallin family protein [bacterium]HMW33564.1 Hsp20/alpha crystallin family protein [bacterium]HMY37304.1 Hsp20/alpha crystallin family protein [bacterium]